MMKKLFSSVRNYDNQTVNQKVCKSCGQPATKEALFEIGGGMMLIERYCDPCVQTVQHNDIRSPA